MHCTVFMLRSDAAAPNGPAVASVAHPPLPSGQAIDPLRSKSAAFRQACRHALDGGLGGAAGSAPGSRASGDAGSGPGCAFATGHAGAAERGVSHGRAVCIVEKVSRPVWLDVRDDMHGEPDIDIGRGRPGVLAVTKLILSG